MSTRETTEHGTYRDQRGGLWLGVARPDRRLEALATPHFRPGTWLDYEQIISEFGLLTPEPCTGRAEDGRPCIRPLRHDTVCRSAPLNNDAPPPEEGTMTVRVRDQGAESPWGSGLIRPAVRTVTIAATCPSCGGPRGTAQSTRQHDDGVTYYVDTWENPCGHSDYYGHVIEEARARGPLAAPTYY
ncbi:hypothetical protein [Nocardiopsis sp. FR26]|uniref:hypothetical protein n=1 Tax=Nocardiopsis sp. FR26 TaxID=2605987 RepID=UPI00135ADEB0|nr:hypothetical protein [Nocardiopsis sp. FR26]